MNMNYVAILISPFVVDWIQELVGVKGERFPFALNSVVGFIALLFMLLRRAWMKRK